MKTRLGFAVLAACVVAVAACNDEPTTPKSFANYSGVLNGSKEVPATTATGTGTILLTVNEKNQMTYNVGWVGLTGNATGAHIHGPADASTTASVLVNFQALPTGSPPAGAGASAYSATAASGGASGTVRLDTAITATVSGDSLKKLLNAGLLYVNVHTAANTGGEIRAQIVRQ